MRASILLGTLLLHNALASRKLCQALDDLADHRFFASELSFTIAVMEDSPEGWRPLRSLRPVLGGANIGSKITDGELRAMSSGTVGAQDWRAVACLATTGERLLCVGESSSQVRAAYTGAWGEVIRDEDRPTVGAISLQRWSGQFWSGQWEHQMYLAVPTARSGKSGPARSRKSSRRRNWIPSKTGNPRRNPLNEAGRIDLCGLHAIEGGIDAGLPDTKSTRPDTSARLPRGLPRGFCLS